MSLQALDALRAEFVRSAPLGRAELYDAKALEGIARIVASTRRSGLLAQ